MTHTSAAYIAGLVDGEGSIGVFINRAPSRQGGAVTARVKIGMCDEALIKWLKAHTNSGCVTSWGHTKNPTWKRCWVITWNGTHAANLISHIKPYLRIKLPQAQLLMQWVDLSNEWKGKLGGRGRNDRAYPDFVWEKAAAIGAEIRKLNQKGIPLTDVVETIAEGCPSRDGPT